MRGPAIPFIVLGVAFIAIGIAGNRAFTTLGLVFLVLGFVKLARAHRKRSV